MKRILFIALSFLWLSVYAQTMSQYPKPYGIDFGATKSAVFATMKKMGYNRSTKYSGMIYENLKFMGYDNSNITFSFNSNTKLIESEVFIPFESTGDAYNAQYEIIQKIKSKYKGLIDIEHFETALNCKVDTMKIGKIIEFISSGKARYFNILTPGNSKDIKITVEVTFNSCVRISFQNYDLIRKDDKLKTNKSLMDI